MLLCDAVSISLWFSSWC